MAKRPLDMKYCPRCGTTMAIKRTGRDLQSCPECEFINWESPAPVATALLFRKGKVVLVRARTRAEKWGFPSGFVEREESAEEGALREIEEETNLRAKITQPLGTYPIFNGRKRILLIAFEAVASASSECAPNEEIAEIREFEPDEALSVLEGEEERKILSAWLAKNRKHLK